jgi:hypothetical protein
MGTERTENCSFLALRRQGAQPKFDIVAIASELARLHTAGEALHVFFDWSQVSSWPFAAPSAAAIREWNKAAPLIARAAFVHDPKWNRHAAILAALLRVSDAEARSFRCVDAEKAIEWLEQASREDDVR